jgi:hypothetical protein
MGRNGLYTKKPERSEKEIIKQGNILKNGCPQNGGFIFLFVVLIFLVCFYAHILDNLLSYDEKHYSGRELTIGMDEEEDEEEKPVWNIVIDLDKFLLCVYKNGKLVRSYPCSGGKPLTPSPTGDFKIISKASWGEGYGGAWLGLNVPWGCYGIHGTKFPWIIGKKHASKGCIRLLSKDAKELLHMVPYGTPVRILQKNRPFRIIKSGDFGSDVRDMEIALFDLGYYDGESDGTFGEKLHAAVVKFQQEHEIRPDGVIDQKTYNLILQMWKEGFNPGSVKKPAMQ